MRQVISHPLEYQLSVPVRDFPGAVSLDAAAPTTLGMARENSPQSRTPDRERSYLR
jgi:hypothetical protein